MSNPLLEIRTPIPFDAIRVEHVEAGIETLLAGARKRLDQIGGDSVRTYANTLGALDKATEQLDYAMTLVRHLEAVATSPELRAARNAVEPKVSQLHSSIPLSEKLWNAVKEFAETEEARALTGVRKRHLEKTLDYFRRHGADLDAAGKKRLEEIDVELTRLTTAFSQHVLDSTNAYEEVFPNADQLKGLPESAVEAARESAKSKNVDGWRFTLQEPSYIALMTYLDDRPARERFYRAYQTRASSDPWNNRPVVLRVLQLRKEKANLLGYSDFADFVLADRMAKSGAQAMKFLETLEKHSRAGFEQENRSLEQFHRDLEGASAPPLQPWDIAYYAEKQRKALYDLDEEELRPYFPIERVIEGMFAAVSRLFGVEVRQRQGVPVWHPDVNYYEIVEGGRVVGAFYADWHPRETKRGGAWMDDFITAAPALPGFFHVGTICGNLTPPVEGKPALLTHHEVETVFHEFGHLLHHCLSRVEVRGLSGTRVAWDFVELPSQIMQNWCWERSSLDLFARHWKTGEPIPEDLFQRMRRARNFRAANQQMRQLGFGFADLSLHRDYEESVHGDPVAYARAILGRFSPVPLPPEHAMILSFTHLFGDPAGYGAAYYSYKWAEVLDADAFALFLENGVFHRETGLRFRQLILESGDGADPAELFRAFRGRDPDLRALLKRQGLLQNG